MQYNLNSINQVSIIRCSIMAGEIAIRIKIQGKSITARGATVSMFLIWGIKSAVAAKLSYQYICQVFSMMIIIVSHANN